MSTSGGRRALGGGSRRTGCTRTVVCARSQPNALGTGWRIGAAAAIPRWIPGLCESSSEGQSEFQSSFAVKGVRVLPVHQENRLNFFQCSIALGVGFPVGYDPWASRCLIKTDGHKEPPWTPIVRTIGYAAVVNRFFYRFQDRSLGPQMARDGRYLWFASLGRLCLGNERMSGDYALAYGASPLRCSPELFTPPCLLAHLSQPFKALCPKR